MPMSDDELRRLAELEAELADQRRLVALARHLGSASVDTGLRRVTMLWIAGGSVGMTLVVVGAVMHSAALLAASVVIVAATLILVGLSSIAVEMTGYRREHRSGHSFPHQPPG